MRYDDEIQREERAIYLVAILALGPVVAIALVRRLSFDGGVTVCLAAVVLGCIGLVANLVRACRRPHLPRARVHPK